MTPAEKMSKGKTPHAVPWGQRQEKRRPRVHTPRLKERRLALGLTQREVAAGCGVSDPIICEAERGREILLTTALKIARFFGATIEELWPTKVLNGTGKKAGA